MDFFFSPMKEFLNVGLKMFYVDYRGMRFLFFFFFFLVGEKFE